MISIPKQGEGGSMVSPSALCVLVEAGPTTVGSVAAPEGDLDRLVRLTRCSARFARELERLTLRLRTVRTYLARPGSNPILGRAYESSVRESRSRVLTQLRANRIEARRLLARLDPALSEPTSGE